MKLGADLHILFGGERELNGQKVGVSQVVMINTTEEIAYELSPITHSRVSHGCALLNNGLVLLSGGVSQRGTGQKAILQDELYNTASGEVTDLSLGQSLKRAQHATLRLGDRILAFGGVDVNNNALAKISEFDITTSTWTNLDRELLSTTTSELVASPFPVAALDFVPHCDCVPATREGRIQGGTQAEVIKVNILEIEIFSQSNAFPWIAALLRDLEDNTEYVNSWCSTVLVSVTNQTRSSKDECSAGDQTIILESIDLLLKVLRLYVAPNLDIQLVWILAS